MKGTKLAGETKSNTKRDGERRPSLGEASERLEAGDINQPTWWLINLDGVRIQRSLFTCAVKPKSPKTSVCLWVITVCLCFYKRK